MGAVTKPCFVPVRGDGEMVEVHGQSTCCGAAGQYSVLECGSGLGGIATSGWGREYQRKAALFVGSGWLPVTKRELKPWFCDIRNPDLPP